MFKEIIIKSLMFINLAEGIIHLVVSIVSFYGMYDLGIWDWRVATAPCTDLFLGIASLITGYVLKDVAGCFHNKKLTE